MARVGIVAEFNPFHTGHKYIIDYAKKELHADSIVIALGHEFTQRGGVAIIDRYTRAKCAIDAGADLVVGMPVLASSASAEIFAECGVCLLHECGCVKIVCGYEGGDTSLLEKIAEILTAEPDAYRNTLQDNLRSGKSFPAAREIALSMSVKQDGVKELVSNPNNILAIEYQKAIIKHGFDMELIPVKRQGTGYNDSTNDGEFVSASYIRRSISGSDFSAIKKHLTPYSYQALKDSYEKKLLLTDDALSLPMHLALLERCNSLHNARGAHNTIQSGHSTAKLHQFSQFFDISDDLSDRITKLLPQYTGFENFAELIKNKSLTASRIRRSLIHILLGITNDDLESLRAADYVPYLWILAASKSGFSILGEIKKSSPVPLFMSINELNDEKRDRALFHLDLKALELTRALRINKSGILIPNEWQRKI